MPVRIHFLNVARGDCTAIEHANGRLTLVDIDNGGSLYPDGSVEIADECLRTQGRAQITIPRQHDLARADHDLSPTSPLDYLTRICPERIIHRYVQTYADLDHMVGLGTLLRAFVFESFWDTDHNTVPDLRLQDRDDWTAYETIRSGASGAKVFKIVPDTMLAHYDFGTDHIEIGDGLQILSPSLKQMECSALEGGDLREASIVLRLTHAGRHVILGASAGQDAWDDMCRRYGMILECDVLKASRHGRDSGFHLEAIKYMKPKHTLISVSQQDDDASNNYERFSEAVYSIRRYGNLICTINDDGLITWTAP